VLHGIVGHGTGVDTDPPSIAPLLPPEPLALPTPLLPPEPLPPPLPDPLPLPVPLAPPLPVPEPVLLAVPLLVPALPLLVPELPPLLAEPLLFPESLVLPGPLLLPAPPSPTRPLLSAPLHAAARATPTEVTKKTFAVLTATSSSRWLQASRRANDPRVSWPSRP
jgi:hypothetical protein